MDFLAPLPGRVDVFPCEVGENESMILNKLVSHLIAV